MLQDDMTILQMWLHCTGAKWNWQVPGGLLFPNQVYSDRTARRQQNQIGGRQAPAVYCAS